MSWPDWQDSGKIVELKLPDGRIVRGTLKADDEFFTGEDEIPIFIVMIETGERINFIEALDWQFATGGKK